MPERSQTVPLCRNGDSRINMLSWVPKNTRLACTPGTSKTNPFYSCQGVQVPVQARTLSPQHCRPDLSMVLRPPQPHIYNHLKSQSGKSHNTWQERKKSSCPHKQVYARDNKSITWPGSMQQTVLNWHRRNKCNQSPALLSNQVQVHPTRSARSPIIHKHLYSMW
jgi:hypothetical protein